MLKSEPLLGRHLQFWSRGHSLNKLESTIFEDVCIVQGISKIVALQFYRRFLNISPLYFYVIVGIPLGPNISQGVTIYQFTIFTLYTSCVVNMGISDAVVLLKISETRALFSLLSNYLLFKKGLALYFFYSDSPSHQGALCKVLLHLAQWFQREGQTNGQQVIRKAHLNLLSDKLKNGKRTYKLHNCHILKN